MRCIIKRKNNMFDKLMYKFFGLIDKLADLIEIFIFGKKKKKK